MDGRTIILVACSLAGGAWALLALGIVLSRLVARPEPGTEATMPAGRGRLDGPPTNLAPAAEQEARLALERGLRSSEADVRIATITALGRLGHRYEWAVDGLVEGLANGVENPIRVASQLDRLAPRPGGRLVPLLGHPAEVVRFYATRLLARYDALARQHVPNLTRDTSPYVRAAALETLRVVSSPEALRCALGLLDDSSPRVRAHACLTAARIAGSTSAPFVAPLLGDESWWVREAARKALVSVGRDVIEVVLPLREHDDASVREGAALVLRDVGATGDRLTGGAERPAGPATGRARARHRVGRPGAAELEVVP